MSSYLKRNPWEFALVRGFLVLCAGYSGLNAVAQNPPASDQALRVAIASSPEAVAEGDLLMASLSDRGYELLERTDLALVIEEGTLTRGSLSEKLDGAGAIVLVERVVESGRELIATRIVGCSDGQVFGSHLHERGESPGDWVSVVDRGLKSLRGQLANVSQDRLKVSVQAIREEYVAGKTENPVTGRAVARLLVAGLSQRPDIRVLERQDLSLVQFERLLARIDAESFEGADRIVTGTFAKEGSGACISIQVADKSGRDHREATASIESGDLAQIALAMAEQVLPLLRESSEAKTGEAGIKPFDGMSEAIRFREEADRALRLGLHEQGAAFAETAYLLNEADSDEALYLLASAELLACLPGFRGVGVDVERGFGSQPGSNELFEAMSEGRDYEEFPLPDRNQWEVLARSAERGSDLLRNARLRNGGDLSNSKALYFNRSISPILKEVALNSFQRFGNAIPNFERGILERIGAGSEVSSGGAIRDVHLMLPDDLQKPYEKLLLDSSRERSIETLRNWLYGPHLADLENRGRDRESQMRRSQAETLRGSCFGALEFQGFDPDNGDSMSDSIDERLVGEPFVAWLSGAGMSFYEAFAAATVDVPEKYRGLAEVDRFWADALIEKRGQKRDEAISSLRNSLRENLDTLRDLGLIDRYLSKFRFIEADRYTVRDGEDLGQFWQEAHRAAYSSDREVEGNLTELLIARFDGQRWSEKPGENPESYLKFLASLEDDLSGNHARGMEYKRKELIGKIASARQSLNADTASPDPEDFNARGTLSDVPESETLVVTRAIYGYDLPTLATATGADGIFLLQQGSMEHGEPARILHFPMSGSFVEIKVPDEVTELVEASAELDSLRRVQRIGAIEVDESRISIGFPGGLANYDRGSKSWEVRPVPFLSGRGGMRFLGKWLVSYTGAPPVRTGDTMGSQVYQYRNSRGEETSVLGFDPPGQAASVHGLYLTSRDGSGNFAVIDNSRQPPQSPLDSAGELRFQFPPLMAGPEQFLVGLSARELPGTVYRVDLPSGQDTPKAAPVAMPFEPGSGGVCGGTDANGFAVISAYRKRFAVPSVPGLVGRLDLAAFAVSPDGAYHWLVDTGTIHDKNGPIDLKGIPKRSIFMNGEKPVYSFPDKFAVHRGTFLAPPVLHYDGQRLLMLTSQLTTDGRRLLYVWNDVNQDEPKRVALRFDCFEKSEKLDEDGRASWNRRARDEIFSMSTAGKSLFFEFRRGFLVLKLEDLARATGG